MRQEYVVGLDLGGTQIRACLADAQGEILSQVRQPTLAREGPQGVMDRMKEAIHEVLQGVQRNAVRSIGIAAPGPLDPLTGMVIAPPNLPGWNDVPLSDIMSRSFDLPVFINNDANLAGLAEHRFGAGRGTLDMIYLTISTGLGGGIICGGQLLLGAHGLAGEPGHTIVDPAGPPCGCGNAGCLEAMAAGPAIASYASELIRQGRGSSLAGHIAGGEELTGEMVGEAAEAGDGVALESVRRAAYYLGIGVLNLIHIFDPQMVILGGGVTKLGPLLFDPVRAWVLGHAMAPVQRHTPIVAAALGDDVGLLGAVAWAIDQFEAQ